MIKIRKKKWKSDIKRIFPNLNSCRPACFVPIENGVLISTVESEVVLYIEGKDLDTLLGMIPWDKKLDPIRKLISESKTK